MQPETLHDLLRHMGRLGDREALRFDNGLRTFVSSYRELYRRIAGFSGHLHRLGLGRGDRLLLWGESRAEWIVAFWGAVSRGIQVVPVDARSSRGLVSRIADEAEPKMLVHGGAQAPERVCRHLVPFADLESAETEDEPHWEPAGPDDVAEIVYTSGTTGSPKGVVHKHRNICANLRPLAGEMDRYKPFLGPVQPIRIMNTLPLSHMFGQALGVFIPVMLEGAAVFSSELRPAALRQTLRKERVTALVAVPRILSQLQAHLRRAYSVDSRRVRFRGLLSVPERLWKFRDVHAAFGWKFWVVVAGGAQIRTEMEDWWRNMGFLVVQGYGLTEASPIVALNHPFGTRRGSLGKVMQGQEVTIAPDGEILVRGENVVSEYFGRNAPQTSGDRWLRTGDIGEIDSEGRLYYKGRKKDLIVTAEGMNVHPEDVEDVLEAFPEVRDSAVVGLPRNGESEVHAALLLADPGADPSEVIARANRQLEPHQRIRGWTVWPEEDFPRTPSTMKVKRREVAGRIRRERTGEPPREERPDTLETVLAELSGLSPEAVSEDSRFAEDLGLASLDRVELLAHLEERYGVDLDEGTFASLSTVGELKEWIRSESLDGAGTSEGGPAGSAEGEAAPGRQPGAGPEAGRRRTPVPPMPRWSRTPPVRALRWAFLNTVLLPGFRLYMRFRPFGAERLEGITPPAILAANHSSHLDTVAALAALPRQWRMRAAPAMRLEHFEAHVRSERFSLGRRISSGLQYYLACGLFNGYPLPQRLGGLRQVLKYTGELTERGYCPLVYPEGIMTPDGSLQPFRPGVGMMAAQLRVPVVPISIRGLFELFPPGTGWPKRGTVRVHIGSPLHPTGREDYQGLADQVRQRVLELAEEADGRTG